MRRRIAIAFLVLATVGCGEEQHRVFRTGEEAKRDRLADRGWVPRWLPDQARTVNLQWNIDTNEVWLAFELNPDNRAALSSQLIPLDEWAIKSVKGRYPRGADWWFEGLIQKQPANDGALNADLFRGKGQLVPSGTIVAFERGDSRRVFAWSERD